MSVDWNAERYHRVSGPMEEMGLAVLDRLRLVGDETVLDAGCGSGRVTAHLVKRLPRGRVIAIDASPAMVAQAREYLGASADVRQVDLLELDLEEPVDVVFSTATFHWVLDHDQLFARLHAVLRRDGRLVAQCGGRGNIAEPLALAEEVASRPPYAEHFVGWTRRTYYASAEETAERLVRTGFVDAVCWLEERPVTPEDPVDYLETIILRDHLGQLPAELERPFVDDVVGLMPLPVVIDYIRLNIDARRADS